MYQKFYRREKKKKKAAQFFIPLEKRGRKKPDYKHLHMHSGKKLNKQKYFTKFTHFFKIVIKSTKHQHT